NSYVSRVWTTSATPGSDRFHELVEERTAVMGPWSGLRMVLNGENRLCPVLQSLDGPIVQVHMRDLKVRGPWDLGFRPLNCESVVLGCDQDLSRLHILHRMIPAPMAIRHLDRLGPIGQREDLMTEADAEDRNAGL